MRTRAAALADQERNRYTMAPKQAGKTLAGAKAILSAPEGFMLAQQSLRMIYSRGEINRLALPAPEHVLEALETLKYVEPIEKTEKIRLTAHGLKMAEKGKK